MSENPNNASQQNILDTLKLYARNINYAFIALNEEKFNRKEKKLIYKHIKNNLEDFKKELKDIQSTLDSALYKKIKSSINSLNFTFSFSPSIKLMKKPINNIMALLQAQQETQDPENFAIALDRIIETLELNDKQKKQYNTIITKIAALAKASLDINNHPKSEAQKMAEKLHNYENEIEKLREQISKELNEEKKLQMRQTLRNVQIEKINYKVNNTSLPLEQKMEIDEKIKKAYHKLAQQNNINLSNIQHDPLEFEVENNKKNEKKTLKTISKAIKSSIKNLGKNVKLEEQQENINPLPNKQNNIKSRKNKSK